METRDVEAGWVIWNGGECPVPEGTHIEARMRATFIKDGQAVHHSFRTSRPTEFHHWDDTGSVNDIIAYRVIPTMFPN